jgi:hypothetical protein
MSTRTAARVEWRAYDATGVAHALRHVAAAVQRHPCGEKVRDQRFAWPSRRHCPACQAAVNERRR